MPKNESTTSDNPSKISGKEMWNIKSFIKKDGESSSPRTVRSSRNRKSSTGISRNSQSNSSAAGLKTKTKKPQSVPPRTRRTSPNPLQSPSKSIGSPPILKTRKAKLTGKLKAASKLVSLPMHDRPSEQRELNSPRQSTTTSQQFNNLQKYERLELTSSGAGTYFYGSQPSHSEQHCNQLTCDLEIRASGSGAWENEFDRDISVISDSSEMDASATIRLEMECGNSIEAIRDIVTSCLRDSPADQAEIYTRHQYLYDNLDSDLVMRFFGSKIKDCEDAARDVFRALVNAGDKRTMLFVIKLCKLITHGPPKARTRLIRRLGRAELTLCVIRALRSWLKPDRLIDDEAYGLLKSGKLAIFSDPIVDELVVLLLHMSERDPHFQARIRDGNILILLCQNMASGQPFSSKMVLSLFRRALISSVNAEICGNYGTFAKDLLNRVTFLSNCFDEPALPLLFVHLELLYYALRDKPTRQRLIEEEGIVKRSFEITNRQFILLNDCCRVDSISKESSDFNSIAVRLDVLVKSVSIIQLLSFLKAARDEFVNCDCIAMIRKGMDTIQSPVLKELPAHKVLQDSLCSLYMSCLPTVPFPLIGVQFPLSFELPNAGGKRPSFSIPKSKTPIKNRIGSLKENLEDSLISEDDNFDDDDYIFAENENTRDSSMRQSFSDKDNSLTLAKQKFSDLCAYDPYFLEFSEDPIPSSSEDFEGYNVHFKSHISKTSSVMPFVKIAYPELKDPDRDQAQQPLLVAPDNMRDAILQIMNNSKKNTQFSPRVIFDLDQLCLNSSVKSSPPTSALSCDDAYRIGKMHPSKDHLLFESRFESGNLRRATQVSPQHYQLILNPDVNQLSDHYQWFYFEVSNMRANIPYTFEIVNCLKTTSMYSQGMQPVMYSVRDAIAGNPRWIRVGDSVSYYRNLFTDETIDADGEKVKKRSFFSIRFDVSFKSKGDVCYFAYHYPYTYSFLMTSIDRSLSALNPFVYVRRDIIGHSLGGNPILLLTATAPGTKQEIAARKIIVISARVHPGESNSSWIMHGLFNELLCSSSDVVSTLLSKFVFKIIPMLNPDGVINGSHRCSLAGVDLNRVWDRPSSTLHPEIFHSKGIIQYLTDVCRKTPWMFLDFHGHSRKSSIFLFGNNPEQSYKSSDKKIHHDFEFAALPEILDKVSPSFSIENCRFSIVPSKESSARVAIWRQFGVVRSYTMEATYCGFQTGPLKGLQIGTSELKKMGGELLVAILETFKNEKKKRRS